MVGTIGKVGTVFANGTNGVAVVTNAGNFNIGGVVAASALLITGFAETASVVANQDSLAEMIGKTNVKAIGKLNTVAAGILAIMDAKNLYDTCTNTGEVKLKDVLSFTGNVMAIGAGIAMISNPLGLAVGAFAFASVAFAGASIAMDKDTNLINHGTEKGQEFEREMEYALKNIKEKANDMTLGKPIENFFDNQVQNAVEKMLENQEKLNELGEKIKKELRDSNNYDLGDVLEKILTPIMELGIEFSKTGDELSEEISDIINKTQKTLKNIWDNPTDWLDNPIDHLPDIVKDWLDLPRTGEYHLYDPIALDLNGNGVIDIIGMNGYRGALFDHDGDGIATATAWVAGVDGLLVLDRNGNGVIMGRHNLNIPLINEEERWVA